jgi:hypothetical protein
MIGAIWVGRIRQLTDWISVSQNPRRMKVETPKASLEI